MITPTTGVYHTFFFIDTAPTQSYTLSLHDALPIFAVQLLRAYGPPRPVRLLGVRVASFDDVVESPRLPPPPVAGQLADRKSTRLNSSHSSISYAVFCLKKKRKQRIYQMMYSSFMRF